MAKESFNRSKPHVNVGTIGHVDHGKTTLTAAITKVQSMKGMSTFIPYDEVAKASESAGRRDATKILTIATSHVECFSIWPTSGSSSPARIFISVDLPVPFGPTSPIRSPGRTSKFKPANTGAVSN